MTKLVIVESPAKCSKIESILGPGYKCTASYGHIRSMVQGKDAIDKETFEPKYEISSDKKNVVMQLRGMVKKMDEVILAADPDREGEAIAYHLIKVLDLDEKTTKRMVFNEINKKSVLKALENTRYIDMDLVLAQQARSVLDRLIGYEISPILWKQIKSSLSAGRCQSPALNVICQRESDIQKYAAKNHYLTYGNFSSGQKSIDSRLDLNIEKEKDVLEFLNKCKNYEFKVTKKEKEKSNQNPFPPFTTSTLQQEASRKIGLTPKACMMAAQKLYEGGFITYMRTDSVNLSVDVLKDIKEYIVKDHGANYLREKKYKAKCKNSQEAHECVRPVDINKIVLPQSTRADQKSLYKLIWQRTIASQMKPCQVEVNKLYISTPLKDKYFVSRMQKILFNGYKKIYNYNNDENGDEENNEYIDLKEGSELKYKDIKSREVLTNPPTRYNEADLVRELEKLGIGRPSTYSNIISKIQERGYVEKKSDPGEENDLNVYNLSGNDVKKSEYKAHCCSYKNKLVPTQIGNMVNEFLNQHFSDIFNYDFTSKMEDNLDKISNGKLNWFKSVKDFYSNLEPIVIKLGKSTVREKDKYIRNLGENKKGNKISIRVGRFGPVLVEENSDYRKKWKFVSLSSKDDVENMTLEHALSLFKFPVNLGHYQGKQVSLNMGRYGYYIQYNDSNYAIKEECNDEDKMECVTLDKAIKTIKEKDADIIKVISDEITVKKGKMGRSPYIMIKEGKKPRFVPIPKEEDPSKLDMKKCSKIISEYKPKKRFTKKSQ